MPETSGEVTLRERKKLKCPHCGHTYEEEIELTGEVSLEFDLSEYPPQRNEGYD